jgi:hypothetical protein
MSDAYIEIPLHPDCDACDAYNEGTCGGRNVHETNCIRKEENWEPEINR